MKRRHVQGRLRRNRLKSPAQGFFADAAGMLLCCLTSGISTTKGLAMNDYVALELGNDWGVPYYGEKGKTIVGGFASIRHGFMFDDGDHYEIEYPDGSHEVIEVVGRKQMTQTSDHGKVDTFHVKYPGFFIDHHGVRAWVPLGDVKVRRDMLRHYSPEMDRAEP